MEQNRIEAKVMCLYVQGDKTLVQDCRTVRPRGGSAQGPGEYYRVLGGTLEFGERAEEGMRREAREELKSEVENLTLLEVVENIYEGKHGPGHQIVYLYKADLVDKSLYEQETIHIVEETYELDAVWVPTAQLLEGLLPLYPTLDYRKYLI